MLFYSFHQYVHTFLTAFCCRFFLSCRYGDMRVMMGCEIFSMWQNLGKVIEAHHSAHLIPQHGLHPWRRKLLSSSSFMWHIHKRYLLSTYSMFPCTGSVSLCFAIHTFAGFQLDHYMDGSAWCVTTWAIMRTKFSFINGTTASIVLIKEKRPKKSWRVYRKKKKSKRFADAGPKCLERNLWRDFNLMTYMAYLQVLISASVCLPFQQ